MAIANTIPEPPMNLDPAHRRFLMELKNAVTKLQGSVVPPPAVTNLTASGIAGAILVQFTRSDADNFILYWNAMPSLNGATRVELGQANQYTDNVGEGSITRYYWIKPKKGNLDGQVSAPVFATSLALGTAATVPTPPAATQTPAVSDVTNQPAQGRPTPTGYQDI